MQSCGLFIDSMSVAIEADGMLSYKKPYSFIL